MAPGDETDLAPMLHFALDHSSPTSLRYPKANLEKVERPSQPVELGQAEICDWGNDAMLIAYGTLFPTCVKAAQKLRQEGYDVGVVNARFVKPLDRTLLLSQAAVVPLLVTMEDHALSGGFGSAVLEALQEADCTAAVERIGWPDKFVEHGTNVDVLRAAHGLSPEAIYRRVLDRWRNLSPQRVETEA